MWTKAYSLRLSSLFTKLFLCILIGGLFFVPWLVNYFVATSEKPEVLVPVMCVAYYTCAGPAALLLLSLDQMLKNLRQGQIFIRQNVRMLRRMSWSCMVVAGICLVSSIFYFPFLLVAAAAGFMGLIIRVLKNVLDEAVALKNESDYTI